MTYCVLDSLAPRGDQSWRYSYHPVKSDGSKGERAWGTVSGCSGKRAARHAALLKITEIERELDLAEESDRDCPTLAEVYAKHVDELFATGSITPGTYHNHYLPAVKRLGWIGDLPVSKIARDDVIFFIAELQEGGYAPSTISEMLSMVRCGLGCAVEEGIIDRDVSARIKAPKRGAMKPRSLSDDEKFRVLRLCESMQGFLPVAIRLALSTGMRRGELCGLRWNAVDLDLELLRVVSSIGQVGHGRFVEKEPKTSASRRRLPIEPGLLDVLRVRRESQERECEKSHIRFSEDMFVLGTPDGRWLNPDLLHRRFAEFSKAFSIAGGKCRLHWLRHTFATSMISHGVDVRTVAAWLGHSDPGFTLRTYVDLDEKAMRDSVEILAASLIAPAPTAADPSRRSEQGRIISWDSINSPQAVLRDREPRYPSQDKARFPRCP